MKNIVLGIIGIFIMTYTVLIGLNILSFQTQKNQVEKQVSRVVKNTLEAEYKNPDVIYVEHMLLEELRNTISTPNAEIEVKIQAMDLEKGILSVKVTKKVVMLNGLQKEIVVEKTAIVERLYFGGVQSNHFVCNERERGGMGKCL